jgi:hypothetical protein
MPEGLRHGHASSRLSAFLFGPCDGQPVRAATDDRPTADFSLFTVFTTVSVPDRGKVWIGGGVSTVAGIYCQQMEIRATNIRGNQR